MSVARRRVGDFDSLLEAWARWLADTRCALSGGGGSMLARWMDAKGHLIFGSSSGGSSEIRDEIEGRIEVAVVAMGRACQLREDVLRLEYAAGYMRVVKRRALVGYEIGGTQLQNALALGVSVRTYRQRLAEARAHIAELLGRKL